MKTKLSLLSRGLLLYFLTMIFSQQFSKAQIFTPANPIDTVLFNSFSNSFHTHKFSATDSSSHFLNQLDSLTAPHLLSAYRVKYLNMSGGWKRIQRDVTGSIKAFEETVRLAHLIGDTDAYIKTRINLATAYGDAGDEQKAITELRNLEDILTKKKITGQPLSVLYANLISFYTNLDIPKAYEYSSKLHSRMRTYDDSVKYFISRQYLLSKDLKYEEAIKTGKKTLIFLKAADLYFLYQSNYFIASAYIESGQVNNSLPYLYKAKELVQQLGIGDTNIDICFGKVSLSKGNLRKAILYFEKAEQQINIQGNIPLLLTVLDGLYKAYRGLHLFEKSLTARDRYIELKDSLAGEEKRKAILDLDARYHLKESRTLLEEQSRINTLQKRQIEEEKEAKQLLLGFAIAFMFLLLLLFNNHRKVIKTSRDLVKERRQLAMEKHKLAKVNRMKDKLFALISHDLRSPVSSLVNYLNYHKKDFSSDPAFAGIAKSLMSVQLVLNNLLQWASVQIKNDEPIVSAVDLEEIIQSLLTQFQSHIEEKQIHITTVLKHSGLARTDETYLQIILRNILSNAIKFTPEKGFIRITTSNVDPSNLKISVRDSGQGIPEEKLASIFTYPSSSLGTMGETGTGLGLTLSKELGEKVNVELWVRSKINVGTEVELYIPKR